MSEINLNTNNSQVVPSKKLTITSLLYAKVYTEQYQKQQINMNNNFTRTQSINWYS